jgi:hypothetical protein
MNARALSFVYYEDEPGDAQQRVLTRDKAWRFGDVAKLPGARLYLSMSRLSAMVADVESGIGLLSGPGRRKRQSSMGLGWPAIA